MFDVFIFVGSMALMDAGIPLKDHVAGLSVGLISDTDPSTGDITDYRILTDILVSTVGQYNLFSGACNNLSFSNISMMCTFYFLRNQQVFKNQTLPCI